MKTVPIISPVASATCSVEPLARSKPSPASRPSRDINPHEPAHNPSAPLPRDKWNPWALELATKSITSDTGLGDVTVRTIGRFNSVPFNRWFFQTFYKTCKGDWSVAFVNRKWPLQP